MLDALVSDCIALPDTELTVLLDDRIPCPYEASVKTVRIGLEDDLPSIWQRSIDENDAIWPIAPETDGLLLKLCSDIELAGKKLLNCPAKAVAFAGSKISVIQRLAQNGLPTVPTRYFHEWNEEKLFDATSGLYVVKPDDGAGCENSWLVSGYLPQVKEESKNGFIVQPWIEGDALSLSILFDHGQSRLLSVNRQLIERSNQEFKLKGLEVNALSDSEGFWQALSDKIAGAMPELWGYAGIDLILTDRGPMILEINPRLTTSYAGLKSAIGINLAQSILDLALSGKLPSRQFESLKMTKIDITHVH